MIRNTHRKIVGNPIIISSNTYSIVFIRGSNKAVRVSVLAYSWCLVVLTKKKLATTSLVVARPTSIDPPFNRPRVTTTKPNTFQLSTLLLSTHKDTFCNNKKVHIQVS